MITLRNKKTDEVTRTYECEDRTLIELCKANIECLLHIALADSDEHIRKLGGERELLKLMNGYCGLIERINNWRTTS